MAVRVGCQRQRWKNLPFTKSSPEGVVAHREGSLLSMQLTLLQCRFPTSTSGSQLSVAMGTPKQGINMSTIAIDNFIFHPFLMHGSLRALHLQPDVAHWPVKSGQHKPSIIAKWYHSPKLCSHTVVHCKGPCSMERKKKKTPLFSLPFFPSLLPLPSAAESSNVDNSWVCLYQANRHSQWVSMEKANLIWGKEELKKKH